MRVQCDVCEKNLAAVMCCADEAALCTQCDARVHAANKLATKHQRVSLFPSSGEPPTCDICQEKSAFFFCLEDRALLCRDCDVSIHLLNSLSASHQRYLLTGTRVALEAMSSESPSDSGNEEAQAVPAQIATTIASTSSAHRSSITRPGLHQQYPPAHTQASTSNGLRGTGSPAGAHALAQARASVGGGAAGPDFARKGSYSDLLSDAVPGWRVDELLNIPELADGYSLADVGSSKAETANLGDFDWTADLSLFDEQVYAESLHEVPQVPPPSAAGSSRMQSALKGRARHDMAVVPDYDDAFIVPDLGLDTAPSAPKRRRNSLI